MLKGNKIKPSTQSPPAKIARTTARMRTENPS